MKNWQKIRENPELLKRFRVREQVTDGIRAYFKERGFAEVETPLLVARPGTEPYLDLFETELLTADGRVKRAFLTTSPELSIKKLLAAGVGNCFEITKSFRNREGIGEAHNSEFTILEWYRVEADYQAIMEDFEGLWQELVVKVQGGGGEKMRYQGKEYNLSRPWKRLSVAEAFEDLAGVEMEVMISEQGLVEEAEKKGYRVNSETRWEEAFYQIMANEIEPELERWQRPVILYDYPLSQAALSRISKLDERLAERFEVYLAGLELGNAFSELTDWREQEERMQSDLALRAKLGKKTFEADSDFIEALKAGVPETAGIAVGVDRLVMLLADAAAVSEVIYLPIAQIFDLE